MLFLHLSRKLYLFSKVITTHQLKPLYDEQQFHEKTALSKLPLAAKLSRDPYHISDSTRFYETRTRHERLPHGIPSRSNAQSTHGRKPRRLHLYGTEQRKTSHQRRYHCGTKRHPRPPYLPRPGRLVLPRHDRPA